WTIEDLCESNEVSATYTYTAPEELTWTDPADDSADACEFDAPTLAEAQTLLNADLAAWVADQQTAVAAAGGCSPTVTNDFNAAVNTLDYCTDGSVTITWTIEDRCESNEVSATY